MTGTPDMGSRPIVLLGAQRFDPTLGDAVGALGVEGPIAIVTAGWQEREAEDEELSAHLKGRTVNLRLHRRAESVFQHDPELRQAHRRRQSVLRHKQDFYRIRLEHALEADQVIRQRKAPPTILDEEQQASIDALQQLDEHHLAQCQRVNDELERTMKPFERPAVERHRHELGLILERCAALAIAGGHVASLLNRLRLFGIAELLGEQPIFAWSAGAMAISERVVLFHDNPPQGPGAAEVLERGLGLCPGVVVLPQPESRLRLSDPERVSVLARRFSPALSLAFPARAHVTYREGRFERAVGVTRLGEDGVASSFEASA